MSMNEPKPGEANVQSDQADWPVTYEKAGGSVMSYNAPAPMTLIERAFASSNLELVKQALELEERHEKNLGKRAFDSAIAKAKAEFLPILKKRRVDFTSAKGRTNYQYEDLAAIEEAIRPALSKYGLDYRFRAEAKPAEQLVYVTFHLSHEDGYYEENTLPGPYDLSGNKNAIQALGSTITYLQRYGLKTGLGLAAGVDDDGNGAGKPRAETISEDQIKELEKLLSDPDVNATPEDLCKALKVEQLSDIDMKGYVTAKQQIANRRKYFLNQKKEQAAKATEEKPQ
jgi:hypothetical protein